MPSLIEEEDIQSFKTVWEEYGRRIITELRENPNDKELSKAVKSSMKTLTKSVNSRLPTIKRQLFLFGKNQVISKRRGRKRGAIYIQPTSLARSRKNSTKRSGKKSITRGRQPKDRSHSQMNVTEEDENFTFSQPKSKKRKREQTHSLKEAIRDNRAPAKRPKKQ